MTPDSTASERKTPAPHSPSIRPSVMVGMLVAVVLLAVVLAVVVFRSLPSDPTTLRRQAAEALDQANHQELKRALDELEAVQPLSSGELLTRAQAEIQLGQPEAALRDLEKIPDSDPLGSLARTSRGQIELRRQRLAVAEHQFKKALELDPNLVQAHRGLIYIYGMQLRRDALDREFQAYARLQTLDYSQCYLWCLGRTVEWDPNEQVQTLRGYLKADPSDRWSRLALAESLRRIGKTEESLKVLEPLPADDPEALAARVQIALDRHDQEKARDLLESAPQDNPALNQIRGQLALSRRDAKAAREYFEAARKADPLDRATLAGLTSALRLLGQKEPAAEVQEQARNLDLLSSLLSKADPRYPPSDPKYPFRVGQACRDAGLLAQAEAWFRLAVANDPFDSQAKQALYDLLHREDTALGN